MHSLIDADGKENKRRKGVKGDAVKSKMIKNIAMFWLKKIMRHTMKRIQSELHKIGTYEVCTIFFVSFYDKRYILDDRINSLAYFHKYIKGQ